MDAIKELNAFMLPHLHQQNIHEGMSMIFELTKYFNQLQNNICILETKLEYITRENELYKTQLKETNGMCEKLKDDIQSLNNTNIVNFLQLTKYELEERKTKLNQQPQNTQS
jgi:hypothetical protein